MANQRGWSLRLWPVFDVQIRYERHLKAFALSINGVHLFRGDHLEATQRVAEQEIVRRIQAMLPAYKVIHARVKACATSTASPAAKPRSANSRAPRAI
jgi:hypothetical protein